jgi:hypothetical protein
MLPKRTSIIQPLLFGGSLLHAARLLYPVYDVFGRPEIEDSSMKWGNTFAKGARALARKTAVPAEAARVPNTCRMHCINLGLARWLWKAIYLRNSSFPHRSSVGCTISALFLHRRAWTITTGAISDDWDPSRQTTSHALR